MSSINQSQIRKRVFIIVMIIVISLPLSLSLLQKAINKDLDATLLGYTDAVAKPEFSLQGYSESTYQPQFAKWAENNLGLHGMMIKSYSTIRYNMFNLGNSTVGKNHDIFEIAYINSELSINNEPDMSIEENRMMLEEYVEKLETLQSSLNRFGKELYVYIAPSKASFDYNNIPEQYKRIASKDSVNAVTYLSELLGESKLHYIVCKDMADELEYPAFYETGIHWSRTFEQLVSARILEDLSKQTNNRYPKMIIGEAKESSTPFWRDADVYNLLNIFNLNDNHIYYEYEVEYDQRENLDKIRFLIQGDSFAQGLRNDILLQNPESIVYFIFRNSYILNKDDSVLQISDWNSFDCGDYLNNTDVVILEMAEPFICSYSFGFVDYLLSYLESYVPKEAILEYAICVDTNNPLAWQTDSLSGIYECEAGYAWAKRNSSITLEAEELDSSDLQLDVNIPFYLFDEASEVGFTVFVNGKNVYDGIYKEPCEDTILIDNALFESEDGLYKIDLRCTEEFNPYTLGINSDNRDFSFMIKYVGAQR